MTTTNAIKIMLGFLSIVMLFHICIILKVIPYEITWGGRLQNDEEMYTFETISCLINAFLMLILLMKGHYLNYRFSEKTIQITLWVFIILFLLNTLGNLFAKTMFEKSFSLITLLTAGLLWKIVKSKNI